jgi:hypothetical protein
MRSGKSLILLYVIQDLLSSSSLKAPQDPWGAMQSEFVLKTFAGFLQRTQDSLYNPKSTMPKVALCLAVVAVNFPYCFITLYKLILS